MTRSNRWLAAFLGGALLILAVVGAVSAQHRRAREQAVRDARHEKYVRAREFTRAYRESNRAGEEDPPMSQRRLCDVPKTETIKVLPNARIYETNYRRGEIDSQDPTVNRVFACLYETGKRTDLGINDTMSGNEFGFAKGAGDFLAYTTAMWLPADGSADCFFVVNLRTQEPVHGDPSCNNAQSSQTVADIVLTEGGSFAYSALADHRGRTEVIAKSETNSKERAVVVFKFDGLHDIRLLHQDGVLKWLDSTEKIQSIPFE